MDWNQLKEEAKKMGADTLIKGVIRFGLFSFYMNGDVYYDGELILQDRTEKQMLAIMKALQ